MKNVPIAKNIHQACIEFSSMTGATSSFGRGTGSLARVPTSSSLSLLFRKIYLVIGSLHMGVCVSMVVQGIQYWTPEPCHVMFVVQKSELDR
jgi:hypothetical protein